MSNFYDESSAKAYLATGNQFLRERLAKERMQQAIVAASALGSTLADLDDWSFSTVHQRKMEQSISYCREKFFISIHSESHLEHLFIKAEQNIIKEDYCLFQDNLLF